MKLVIIESPLSGDVERNTKYARECLLDSLKRGEAPLASHLLYTQVLDDTIPEERERGMYAGFAWGAKADLIAVYTDYGISKGMALGLERSGALGLPVEYRKLYD